MYTNKIYLEIFILFIFDVNPLILIINGIMLLNVFVINYYLYNLLKNTIFLDIFKIFRILFIILIIGLFIVFNLDLFIINNEICALSPKLLNPDIPVVEDFKLGNVQENLGNVQENLEDLQQKFVAERTDYNNQKLDFDKKINYFSDYFNRAISHIEFTKTNTIIYLKSSENNPYSVSLNT